MKTAEGPKKSGRRDTEITLGTGSLLGIFFALALICGVFFGFGYSLGRTNSVKAPGPVKNAATAGARSIARAGTAIKTVVETASGEEETKPSAGAPLVAAASAQADGSTVAASAGTTGAAAVPASYPAQASASAPAAAQPQPASQAIMVQIAAVSRPEDADALVSALRKLGYDASARASTADRLLHVQIGPFANTNEAKAMRARLLSDGYDAILK